MTIKYEIEVKNNDEVIIRRIENETIIDEISVPFMALNFIKGLFFDAYTESIILKRRYEK